MRTGPNRTETSELGTAKVTAGWKVIELWTLKAADLLATNDVGLIPWIPLTQIDGPPELVLQECRDRIDRDVPEQQQPSFRAVTEFLARMVHPSDLLDRLFRKGPKMIDSPALADAEARNSHRLILSILKKRRISVPQALEEDLRQVYNLDSLEELAGEASTCVDLVGLGGLLASLPKE